MSQENVELVRDRYERYIATGEQHGDWWDPDFVWDMSTFTGWPEKQFYQGLDGLLEFQSLWFEAWDDWRMELEELHGAGDDKVVVIISQYGRSKFAGVEVEMRLAQVWTLRGDRYLRMQMYADPREALEAAGLRE